MRPVCWITRRRLGAYQDGELGPAALARAALHLERCGGCSAELAALGRLRTALTMAAPEPSEAEWDAFWPQVEARLARPEPEPTPRSTWLQGGLAGTPRWALGSALAVAALAWLAVLAPWQAPEKPATTATPAGTATPAVVARGVSPAEPMASRPVQPVVVQAVETADPQSSAMVFSNEDADTVVWVFGLTRTEI